MWRIDTVLLQQIKGNYFSPAPRIQRLYATAAAVAKKPMDSPGAEAVTPTNIPVQHLRCKINENVYVIVLDTPGAKVRS
jgi:hypothetical protein